MIKQKFKISHRRKIYYGKRNKEEDDSRLLVRHNVKQKTSTGKNKTGTQEYSDTIFFKNKHEVSKDFQTQGS